MIRKSDLSKDFDSFLISCLGIGISLSSPDRGVVIEGPEYENSCLNSLIDSEMAGPMSMKLSGIDQGKYVIILGPKK